jgi:hypothetical protein
VKYVVVRGMCRDGLKVCRIVDLEVPCMRVRLVFEDMSVYAMATSKRIFYDYVHQLLVHLLKCYCVYRIDINVVVYIHSPTLSGMVDVFHNILHSAIGVYV